MAQRRALASVPFVVGDELWVPLSELGATAGGAAAPCVIFAVDKGLLFVEREDDGARHCVPRGCVDRRGVARDIRPPAAIYSEAGVEDLGELCDRDAVDDVREGLQRGAARRADEKVDGALRTIAASLENFGRVAAAGILNEGDSIMAASFLGEMLENGELGPAMGEVVAECLAERVFSQWRQRRRLVGEPASTAELRTAYRALLDLSDAYVNGAGRQRVVACVELVRAAAGRLPGRPRE